MPQPPAETVPPDRSGPPPDRPGPWGGVPMPLPGPVTGALWAVLVLNTAIGSWLAAVLAGAAPCSGPFCTIATWGHPEFLVVLAVTSVVNLGGAALVTRGLSEAGAVSLGAIVLGAASGVAAVSGLVALLLIVLAAIAVTVVVVAAVLDRV